MLKVKYNKLKAYYRFQIREAKKIANVTKLGEADNKVKTLRDIVNRSKPASKVHKTPNTFTPDEFHCYFVKLAEEIRNILTDPTKM